MIKKYDIATVAGIIVIGFIYCQLFKTNDASQTDLYAALAIVAMLSMIRQLSR